MNSLLFLLSAVIELYIWVVLIQVILSWLVAFNVINMRNQFVYTLGNMAFGVLDGFPLWAAS